MHKFLNNHIIMSGFYKGISGLSLFISIRLLIDYLGNENYGIWVLIFTLFQLVLLMDFGIQSSLKTKIPVFVHEQKNKELKEFIATVYKFSLIIGFVILLFFFLVTKFIDLKSLFNIPNLSSYEVNFLFILNIGFFCSVFVANIHKSLFVAFLKGKFAEESIAVNQVLFLFVFFFFSILFKEKYSTFEKLLFVSLINGGVSLLVNIAYTYRFFKNEKMTLNVLKNSSKNYIHDIFKLGVKFMILQIGFLFIFSSDSYIISNVFNPKEVVAYEIVNKLFQLPYMILFAALSPLWSMFAKHYLEKSKKKLLQDFALFNKYFLIIIALLFLLYFVSPTIISLWIKEPITIPKYLIILTTIITLLKIYVSFFIFFLSGIGKLNFYLSILVISLLIKIPLSYYFVDLGFGINSVLLSSLLIVFVWALLIPSKCYKITEKVNA